MIWAGTEGERQAALWIWDEMGDGVEKTTRDLVESAPDACPAVVRRALGHMRRDGLLVSAGTRSFYRRTEVQWVMLEATVMLTGRGDLEDLAYSGARAIELLSEHEGGLEQLLRGEVSRLGFRAVVIAEELRGVVSPSTGEKLMVVAKVLDQEARAS